MSRWPATRGVGDGPPPLTLLGVAGTFVIQRESEHRSQAAQFRAVMFLTPPAASRRVG